MLDLSKIWISSNVEDYFASSSIGTQLEVNRVACDDDHPIAQDLQKTLALVPKEAVTLAFKDNMFCFLHEHESQVEQDRSARLWIISKELDRRICIRRKVYLLAQHTESRPEPYNDPALIDLTVSEDGLVPLSEFIVEESVLLRKGYAYTILPLTPSLNSSYWITRALVTDGLLDHTWVRLDPLIKGPADEFPRMFYQMLWWGPPLCWKDIKYIQGEKFGRWISGTLSNKSEFTDFAWVSRGKELHLYLEEMPKLNDINKVGSRYFHVIFCHKTEKVIHLDGATRIYSEPEWKQRQKVHVHRAGKVGTRVKIFRIDDPIQPDVVSNLGGTFFVWNYDVSYFFGASVPEPLMGILE
jgi:hypothetical protein